LIRWLRGHLSTLWLVMGKVRVRVRVRGRGRGRGRGTGRGRVMVKVRGYTFVNQNHTHFQELASRMSWHEWGSRTKAIRLESTPVTLIDLPGRALYPLLI
jgi:hypothetical protein